MSRLCAIALFMCAAPSAGSAQRIGPVPVTTIDSTRADGSVVKVPLRSERTGFDLYSELETAGGSIRSRGLMQGAFANLGGPVPFVEGSRFPGQIGGGQYQFFNMGFIVATGPSAYNKIRAVHSGVSTMIGSAGYTAHFWNTVSTPQARRMLPADGQFGKVFSGAAVVFGDGCQDDNYFFRNGDLLLPMRDCPATWGSEGFRGKIVVPQSAFLNRFQGNVNAFRFDEWRVAPSQTDSTAYVGTASVYGYMSDYNADLKALYGTVVRGGTRPPIEQGYPLGLLIRIDAWTLRATPNTQWYQARVINRSADVYGTGIDYDSLYFGLGPGFIRNSGTSLYVDFASNSVITGASGTSGRCSATYPRRYTGQTAGCTNGTRGWAEGTHATTWLKSPLGDLRNKAFSDPTSPFYAPNHPAADDTITVNHMHFSTFGNEPNRFSMRAAFGMASSTELNFLDERTPTTIGLGNYLSYFQPEIDPGGVAPSVNLARFNRFVPGALFGKWDYNNDGIQDTVFIPACGRLGCAQLWSDTIAGGFRNNFGNVNNSVTAGPFGLKAGDTTEFLFAFTFESDSLAMKRSIAAVVSSYMNGYAESSLPAFPVLAEGNGYIVDNADLVDSAGGGVAGSANAARVTLRMPVLDAVDPFLLSQIARIRADSIAADARTLRILRHNSGLLARLTARARDILADVSVYKSCDGGITFTATVGARACVSAPLKSAADKIPWSPVARVTYAGGRPGVAAVVDYVQAGKTYMYLFVTRTRGLLDIPVIDSGASGFVVSNLRTVFALETDSLSSTFSPSNASTIQLYAPIRGIAGRRYAYVDTATTGGRATRAVQAVAVSQKAQGASTLYFGNRLIYRKTIDSVAHSANTTITLQYVLDGTTDPATAGTRNFVAMTRTFTVPADIPLSNGNSFITGRVSSVTGSTVVFADTITGTREYVWVDDQQRPIAAGVGFDSQERFQAMSPLFPGYSVVPLGVTDENDFRLEVTRSGVLRRRNFIVRPTRDTLNAIDLNLSVHAIGGNGRRGNGGSYRITWSSDPWGPAAPFDITQRATVQAQVDASLGQVAAAAPSLTRTDSVTSVVVGGVTVARPLVRMHVPFTMTYTDVTGRVDTVQFAARARLNATRLLGSGSDTVRVQIPDTLWMPGDTLHLLHKVERDSTIGTTTRFAVLTPETIAGAAGFRPIRVVVDSVGITNFLIGCSSPEVIARPVETLQYCNPVRGTPGAAPYHALGAGWTNSFEYAQNFESRSVVQLNAVPLSAPSSLTESDRAGILVVPNPYVIASGYDTPTGAPRLLFTGVPEQGTLRIYTVSGQFVREFSWTGADLVSGGGTTNGDIAYDLRTQSGRELAGGLYMFTISSAINGKQLHRGKFVVIR